MWQFGEKDWHDFGLNGFTESLGIAITIFLIDFLQERREELRLLPKRRVAHEDVRLLVVRITSFWYSNYVLSVPGPSPSTFEELLNESSIAKVYRYLDMNSQPNVTPARSWWQFFPEQLTEFQSHAEKILERHNTILDPIAYDAVHKLANCCMNPGIINGIRQSDAEFKTPRPQILGSYFFTTGPYFSSLLLLAEWCNEEAKKIKKLDKVDAMEIDQTFPVSEPRFPPPCMIKQEVYEAQAKAMADFQSLSLQQG